MVFHKPGLFRTQFRNLPTGAAYWLVSNTAVAPLIKVGPEAKAGALATDAITQTAITDVSVAVAQVPYGFLHNG